MYVSSGTLLEDLPYYCVPVIGYFSHLFSKNYFEFYSPTIILRIPSFRMSAPESFQWIKEGTNLTIVGILIEDYIAVLGVVLAVLGIEIRELLISLTEINSIFSLKTEIISPNDI